MQDFENTPNSEERGKHISSVCYGRSSLAPSCSRDAAEEENNAFYHFKNPRVFWCLECGVSKFQSQQARKYVFATFTDGSSRALKSFSTKALKNKIESTDEMGLRTAPEKVLGTRRQSREEKTDT